MKTLTRPTSRWNFLWVLFLAWSLVPSTRIQAQDNAVYDSSGTNQNTVHSKAFIDASVLQGSRDFCDTIYQVLHSALYTPAVIDARGISSTMTCISGTPWFEKSLGYVNKPSTILLPAGTITANTPWVLPANTKLIGVAKSSSSNYIVDTTIKAGFSSGAVVKFGDSNCTSSGCQGISVEHLTINGNGQTVNGIENDNCGVQCTVDHVTMYQVLGTGLMISGVNATDSGPYSNITFDVGGASDASSQCAWIIGTSGTRGMFVRESRSSYRDVTFDAKTSKTDEVPKTCQAPWRVDFFLSC
jgi:hypothetical protein